MDTTGLKNFLGFTQGFLSRRCCELKSSPWSRGSQGGSGAWENLWDSRRDCADRAVFRSKHQAAHLELVQHIVCQPQASRSPVTLRAVRGAVGGGTSACYWLAATCFRTVILENHLGVLNSTPRYIFHRNAHQTHHQRATKIFSEMAFKWKTSSIILFNIMLNKISQIQMNTYCITSFMQIGKTNLC